MKSVFESRLARWLKLATGNVPAALLGGRSGDVVDPAQRQRAGELERLARPQGAVDAEGDLDIDGARRALHPAWRADFGVDLGIFVVGGDELGLGQPTRPSAVGPQTPRFGEAAFLEQRGIALDDDMAMLDLTLDLAEDLALPASVIWATIHGWIDQGLV